MYQIEPMSLVYTKEIFTWRYPDEYALYNLEDTPEMQKELLNGKYYVCLNGNKVIGLFAFDKSARIPAVEDDAYEEGSLDIGLALRPDLCGQGYGSDFLRIGMTYAKRRWKTERFRLTVAAFNQRAIKAYQRVGFRHEKMLNHRLVDLQFWVMCYDECN